MVLTLFVLFSGVNPLMIRHLPIYITPAHGLCLSYFSLYRSSAHPFNPILFDIDHFEFDMCRYLQALDSGQLGDAKKINEQWFSNKSIAFIALLLATLASGCHFSLPQISESYERCLQLSMDLSLSYHSPRFLFRLL